jgi:hypothetical protein
VSRSITIRQAGSRLRKTRGAAVTIRDQRGGEPR